MFTTFALTLPVMLAAGGASLDYARGAMTKTKMQSTADSAALMSARELQLASTTADKITAVAKSYAEGKIPGVKVAVDVDTNSLAVKVTLNKDIAPAVGIKFLSNTLHIKASATAKLTSGLPLCLIGLDKKAPHTIALEKNALLTAPGCMVYSNSESPKSISSKNDAILKAGFICSAGGKSATANANFTPQPATDCPTMPDPLADRPPPVVGACNHLAKIVAGGVTTLQPGVYCGGLIITLGAKVTMAPGIYVIKDGPLLVNGDATLTGENVALYMKGLNSSLKFEPATTISLSAPKDGPLSGILVYDDPSGASALISTVVNPLVAGKYTKLLSSAREHLILSDNARKLLGTIYMPKGRLIIDATKPVADKSAYTVLVVQQLDLYDGPNLILNTDYSASDIPVPPGLGNYGGKVLLTN